MKTNQVLICRFLPFCLIAILLNAGCMKNDPVNRPFKSFSPVAIDDGWQLSYPSAENVDSLGLVQIYHDLYQGDKAWALKSMLVFRNNKLIAESYLKSDQDRMRYNAIWSCTKQVTGIVAGFALEEGYIHSVNDSIQHYLPEELVHHQDKKDITIEQLLTMRSGIAWNNDVQTDVFRKHSVSSSVDYVLGRPLSWSPGTHFEYNDGTPQLLSAIMQKTTGKTLAQYADSVFFSRIGLTRYRWEDYSDGVTLGAFGLMMPPRELAKIAQCVCDSGRWNNEQIIPAVWYQQMLTDAVPDLYGNLGFGYQWWVNPDQNLALMWGHGGQFAVIYPSKELVIVFTSLEQISADYSFWLDDALYFSKRIYDISE